MLVENESIVTCDVDDVVYVVEVIVAMALTDTEVFAVNVGAIILLVDDTTPVNCPPALGRALLATINAALACKKAPLAYRAAELA